MFFAYPPLPGLTISLFRWPPKRPSFLFFAHLPFPRLGRFLFLLTPTYAGLLFYCFAGLPRVFEARAFFCCSLLLSQARAFFFCAHPPPTRAYGFTVLLASQGFRGQGVFFFAHPSCPRLGIVCCCSPPLPTWAYRFTVLLAYQGF